MTVKKIQVDGRAMNADWWLATVADVLDRRRRRARRLLASSTPAPIDPDPLDDDEGGPGGDDSAPPPVAEVAATGATMAVRGLAALGAYSFVT